ncbi:MAG: PHP domain-containing protein [Candidatus Latescibacteria bacterium]|nr:PHP domain-containing protein [Candidatus Latescibacterota bacterium]NIO56231.1 PHP domain-containing protein [Candidatus Latescibacterota bacterium]
MENIHKIPPFVHLRVRSFYSIGEGLSSPAEICSYASRSGYKSVAITDTNHTYGFLEFHREARKHELKPIYGAVLFHTTLATEGEQQYPLTAIAISSEGLRHLVSLASLSHLLVESGSGLGSDLLELNAAGLAILLDSRKSEPAQHVSAGNLDAAAKSIKALKAIFGDLLFIEIREDEDREDRELAKQRRALAAEAGVKPVLTEDVCYVGADKRGILGLLGEIRHPNLGRDFFSGPELEGEKGMKPAPEMAKRYYAYHDAYENALAIDRMVPGDLLDEWRLDEGEPDIKAPVWRFEDPMSTFLDKVVRRFDLHFHYLSPAGLARGRAILNQEIEQITRLGLERLFLLYHEVITRLQDARISLGPATGLGVQSLCAYLLGITSFNPYQFDEGFQPLLEPASGRSGILEIQLGSEDREEAVQCLRDVFDQHCIAYVPTVDHITSSRALKITAKSLEIDDKEVSEALRITMQNPGRSLQSLFEESKGLGQIYRRSARIREVLSKAAAIEGLPCGFIHSKRSVVVSPRAIREFLGYTFDKSKDELFVQATREAFPVGNMYRIDFTPLGALTVCVRTDNEIRKQKLKVHLWDSLPIDDKAVWADVQGGKATGVYLLENPRIQKQTTEFSPQSIEDLTHFLALMRLRDEEKTFSERLEAFQSGTEADYDYMPDLVPLLNKTHGAILYEEQLRDLLSMLTGVSAEGAYRMLDHFRTGDPGVLSNLRRDFMSGTADQDVPMEAANEWFEKILYYSDRVLNRQRILADALLVYKAYYLKHHHPFHYYLSLLNTYWNNETKVKNYLAYLHDLDALLPIDINRSELYFTLENGKIRLGFYMVEGVSYPSVLRILKARGRRKYRSLENFIRRTKGKGVSVEEVGRLILVGAFDFTGISRTNLVNALPELYEQPVNGATRGLNGQYEMQLSFPPVSEDTQGEEKEALFERLIKGKQDQAASGGAEVYDVVSSLDQFYSKPIASQVEIDGRISNLQRLKTKSGRVLGFFILYDVSALVQIYVPWDRFGLFGEILEEGRDVIVRGRVTVRDERKVCEATEIKSVGEEADEEEGDLGGEEKAEEDT